MNTGTLPWLILGVGALGLGAVLVLRKKGPPQLPPGPLTPEVKSKVSSTIATSNDPAMLQQLARGLQKSGAVDDAMQALKKVADMTGIPQVMPGMPPIQPESGLRVPMVTQYKVASGDIPGAIATRFGVSLSSLAGANGANKARIMGGKINVGETLKLPAGSVDKGPQTRAKGTAS
jgi:LysM repeat protein